MTTASTATRRRLSHSRHPWPHRGLMAAAAMVCALWAIAVAAQAPVGSVYERRAALSAAALPSSSPLAPATDSPAPPPESADGTGESAAAQAGRADRVITAALAGMARAPTLSARVRHLVRVDDIVLKGSGRYVQSGVGEDQRYRYEYRLSGFKEDFEVLDVCDGLFAWNFRRVGPNPPQVERIDVRRIRERLETIGVAHRKDQSAYLGGIQRHLSLLRHYYRFKTITSGSIDDVPVWIVEGLWDKEALAWIVKDQAEAIKSEAGVGPHEIPDGIPWSVRLSISKRELFPCRVEWFAVPGRRPAAAAAPQVVATMELYDVRIGDPVDVSAFVYKPATEGLTDITDAYIPQVYPLPQ